MANGHLIHLTHARQEWRQVIQAEVVPRIDAQARLARGTRALAVAGQHLGLTGRAKGLGIGLGVELDAIRPNLVGQRHLLGLGVHEQADPHTRGTGLGDQRTQTRGILRETPAVVTGELPLAVGYERGLIRPLAQHETHQVVKRVALDIELPLRPLAQQTGQCRHVVRTDVTCVRAWMYRDALGTGLQTQGRRPGHTGNAQVPGVADQGDLVEIDGQRGGHGNAMINR
ncbi:MAG: hypothetical protein RJA29_2642 [Pseudomonadota bacterium]